MFDKAGTQKLVALMAPVGLAVSLSLGAASVYAGNYLTTPAGKVVNNGYKECWKAVHGMQKNMPMCGDAMEKPAMPQKEMDSDGDGVVDSRDECPNTARGVDVTSVGCPADSDGDGVPNFKEKCPGTMAGAKVNQVGCEITGNITINTTADHFDFDSAKLKPAMTAALDNVATQISATPGQEMLEVIGHTDSSGPEAYNQGLSERRAQAAADYLANKGISGTTVKGMGESSPVADNATREGRMMNRRVEIRTK